jgi:hypothetical protein
MPEKRAPLLTAEHPDIQRLLAEWHAAGRAAYAQQYPDRPYDLYARKSATTMDTYIHLDEAGSVAFLVNRRTGIVYRVRVYGRTQPGKRLGHVSELSGDVLYAQRYW